MNDISCTLIQHNITKEICIFVFCLVFDAYEAIAEMSIEDSIKNELSGDFERLMLAVGKKHSTHTSPFCIEGTNL